jgi:heme-degrading monooxygenase HmoA
MLLKWIVCTIVPAKRKLFSESQAKWGEVRHVPGFLGQLGGWNVKDPSEACILAFWENEERYKAFMEKHHDPIYETTNQRGTYDGIQVTACHSIADISGMHDHILPSPEW